MSNAERLFELLIDAQSQRDEPLQETVSGKLKTSTGTLQLKLEAVETSKRKPYVRGTMQFVSDGPDRHGLFDDRVQILIELGTIITGESGESLVNELIDKLGKG